MDQYAGSPGHSTYCYQNWLRPLSTSSTTAHHLLGFIVQGKITEADTPTSRRHPIQTIGAPTSITPSFMLNAPSVATHPIYPCLGQAISREFRVALPWELLYADDLAVIAETEEERLRG